MNLDNLHKLATWLEAGAPHAYFDMRTGTLSTKDWDGLYRELNIDNPEEFAQHFEPKPDCGTVCCIAGAAHLMKHAPRGKMFPSAKKQQELAARWPTVRAAALNYLGLPHNQSVMGHDLFDMEMAPPNCTPEQAAVAVRRVMAGLEPWA